jgi:uncharacterized protein
MIRRAITDRLKYFAGKYPVVSLTGPRQSGKSTLLQQTFPDYHYVNFEDPDVLLMAKDDPRLFLANYPDRTIIDEAQRFPELFSYIQTHVDKTGNEGMYLLSGSHNFLLMEKISQTLAGRTALLKLLPFTREEISGYNIDRDDLDGQLFRGGYPRIYEKGIHPSDFYPFYIQTYIERDVRQLQNISDMDLFIRFVKMCAGRIGQLLNLSSLANECGISQPTAKGWLSVLEASYIVFLQKPYFGNFTKRLVKTPKLYFFDTGLACSLLGINDRNQLFTHYMRGNLFENYILLEFLKNSYNAVKEPEIYFWRDNVGNEIDLLTETQGKLKAYEIKSGMTYREDFFRSRNYWEKLPIKSKESFSVVYGGNSGSRTPYGQLISWKDWP